MPESATDSGSRPARGQVAGRPAVALLRWPEHADRRRHLATTGEPRVLVISDFATPPSRLDDLELWVLDVATPSEILAAMETLRRRTRTRRARPVLDADGLLWFDGDWIAIPHTQLPVVDLLVRHLDTVVADDELRGAYRAAGGSARLASFRTQLHRIGRRVADIGLRLRIIRAQGALLTAPTRYVSQDL